MDGLSIMRDWSLVPSLALRGVAPGGHLIANAAALGWVISLLVRALTCCVPLVMEMSLGAWFYRQTQASHAVGLNRVEAGDGH